MQTLEVSLEERSYPIYIQSGLLGEGYIRKHVRAEQALVVTNQTVAPLYLDRLLSELQGLQCDVLTLPDGEQYKNMAHLEHIFDLLLEKRHSRTTTLIALGGGVVGDMTGFAAACYQRGVHFIQVPTTLLAQVDSSVGGKTAVNHPRGKNMIGAFHQPQAVVIDTDVLTTLPGREMSAGLAEVIKYGLIRDPVFLEWLKASMSSLRQLDGASLSKAIYESCRNKAEVVAEDETEQGNRALLNLGHTFGHAIETAQQYKDWLHGEAVGAGMVMAAKMSRDLGWLEQSQVEQVQDLVEEAGLPTQLPGGISSQQFIELMYLDKKVQSGQLRLVLLKTLGQAVVTDDFKDDVLRNVLENNVAK